MGMTDAPISGIPVDNYCTRCGGFVHGGPPTLILRIRDGQCEVQRLCDLCDEYCDKNLWRH